MILPIILLTCLGITVIFSSDSTLAIQQILFALFGLLLYFGINIFDYRALKPLVNVFYIVSLIFLGLVLIIGIESRGSVRWIPLGVFNFQPSELSKISLILLLAKFWSIHLPSWRNIFISLIMTIPTIALVFFQPDLGTALTISFIWLGMLLSTNISFAKQAILSLISLILTPIIWFLLHDYQRLRLLSFLSPSKDPLGHGYNIIQSVITVGSGQFLGRGLGRGTQSRLQFLPEARTDFIFAFIAEELGFIGSMIVLSLYLTILFLCLKILTLTHDKFGEMIIMGVLSMVFFQILVNIGMNIGIMPITGITLPLLSYGGSSIITILLGFGLVSSVKRHSTKRNIQPNDYIFGLSN